MAFRKGDQVFFKPEWQDPGDENFSWFAVEDEDGGRVKISPTGTGLVFAPVHVVATEMLIEAMTDALPV